MDDAFTGTVPKFNPPSEPDGLRPVPLTASDVETAGAAAATDKVPP